MFKEPMPEPIPESNIGKPSAVLPPPESLEVLEKMAGDLVEQGIDGMKVAEGAGGERAFHSDGHILSMLGRADKLGKIFKLPPGGESLYKIGIAWHDTIINSDKPTAADGVLGKIRRHRGAREGDAPFGGVGNEALSAAACEKAIREACRTNNVPPEDVGRYIESIRFQIEATYPGVDFGKDFQGLAFQDYPDFTKIIEKNPEMGEIILELGVKGITKGNLFYQPHLENALKNRKDVPLEVIITTLSDLGAAGMNTEEFLKEGLQEYVELNWNLRGRLVGENDELSAEERVKVAEDVFKWLDSQVGFAVLQMLRNAKIRDLLKENGVIDDEQEKQFKETFSHFEDSIKRSYDRAQEVKKEYEATRNESGDEKAMEYLLMKMGFAVERKAPVAPASAAA
jgi:hypothetical protein